MKKRITAIILAMLMLSGCGAVDEDVEDNSNQPPEELNMNLQNSFDFDRITDNIYFNDDKLELLKTIGDWGEFYHIEFEFESEINGMKCDEAKLFYKSFYIGNVYLKKSSDDINNEKIFSISFDKNTEGFGKVNVDNIKTSMKNFEITDRYGEPDEIQQFDDNKIYYYRANASHFIMITFDKDDKVCGINVCDNEFS